MHISSIRIKNYKSYFDSGVAELKEGRNLVLGRNSVGKTSLAEMLTGSFSDNPHKSLRTLPNKSFTFDTQSKVEIEFSISSLEISDFIIKTGNKVLIQDAEQASPRDIASYLTTYFNNKLRHTLKCIITNPVINIEIVGLPKYRVEGSINNQKPVKFLRFAINQNSFVSSGEIQEPISQNIWYKLYQFLITQIYCFKAERLNIGISSFGSNSILNTDASNLPEVLNFLQSTNPSKFKRYNQYVNFIFPEIKGITIKPVGANVEIFIWTIEHSTERDDLAISLSKSGTGYGQILAMLYVVLESEPRIIIIDEPQSFLHPGAAKKLMEILKENKQHQYILTTHSSTIVSSSNPQTITLIKNDDSQSKFEPLKNNDSQDIKNFLAEIGSRLSDVFGADNILWVEGATEEQCFPIIMDAMNISAKGTNIVGIINTGDVESRFKKTVLQAYQKLCKGNTLMPPAVGFVFDKEGRTQNQIDDFKKQSKGEDGMEKVEFLPRRMYENYLLNPKAISILVNQIDGFSKQKITNEQIDKWIEDNREKKIYWNDAEVLSADQWRQGIHAGKFLHAMFTQLSESRVEYRKTTHSIKLTQIILEENPDDLKEIADIIKKFIKQ